MKENAKPVPRWKVRTTLYKDVQNLLDDAEVSGMRLMTALKKHPTLRYWYLQQLGGADNMTLEAHTIKVVEHYESYFERDANIFLNNSYFKLLLALHDLGKPKAVMEKQYEKQHEYTLKIIDAVVKEMPLPERAVFPISVLINGDPIGRYLNRKYLMPIGIALGIIRDMANKLSTSIENIWSTLLIYYQCDVSGYDSLRNKVFVTDIEGRAIYFPKFKRFQFKDREEMARFEALERLVFQ